MCRRSSARNGGTWPYPSLHLPPAERSPGPAVTQAGSRDHDGCHERPTSVSGGSSRLDRAVEAAWRPATMRAARYRARGDRIEEWSAGPCQPAADDDAVHAIGQDKAADRTRQVTPTVSAIGPTTGHHRPRRGRRAPRPLQGEGSSARRSRSPSRPGGQRPARPPPPPGTRRGRRRRRAVGDRHDVADLAGQAVSAPRPGARRDDGDEMPVPTIR